MSNAGIFFACRVQIIGGLYSQSIIMTRNDRTKKNIIKEKCPIITLSYFLLEMTVAVLYCLMYLDTIDKTKK